MGVTGTDRGRDEVAAARFRRRTEGQLVAGGFAIIAVAGGAILWWRFGGTTAGITLAVLLLACGLFAVLWLLLVVLERWARSE
jgi:hypothetical protein